MGEALKPKPCPKCGRPEHGAYSSLLCRQRRLGEKFEAAIFDDLDGLYEIDETPERHKP